MNVLKRFKGILFLAAILGTLPFSLRGIAWGVLSIALRDTPSHKVAIGPCKISTQGISFSNIDIEWNENRFSCDEIEFKLPSVHGHFRLPVVFQHPQILLSGQSSYEQGLGASFALFLKLDPFVNHGVVEILEKEVIGQERLSLSNIKDQKAFVQRYYFWSEYLDPTEKIFFFDRNPLPQGEAIASLLVRHEGPAKERYELRIDNLDGSTLLSLIDQKWSKKEFAIQSAPEGLLSLRAAGTWDNDKLTNVDIEMDGIHALLFHPLGMVKAEEWSAKVFLEEALFPLNTIPITSITGQLDLRKTKIQDASQSQFIEGGEVSVALQKGLVSGRVIGALQSKNAPYQMELRGTADLIQNAIELSFNVKDSKGVSSGMEITAQQNSQQDTKNDAKNDKGWESLIAFDQFPVDVLSTSLMQILRPEASKTHLLNGLSKSLLPITSLPLAGSPLASTPIGGKLQGYCQVALGNEMTFREANLDLDALEVSSINWKLSCPKLQLNLVKNHKMDLLFKTAPFAFAWKGEKIAEGQIQLSQNPQTKLAGFLEGNFQGQPVSLSWIGDLKKGVYSINTSELNPDSIRTISSPIARMFNGLRAKGSWTQEKDRWSVEIKQLFSNGHGEIVFFEDGTGGFYFEQLPLSEILPIVFSPVGFSEGTLRGSGQWNHRAVESTMELSQFFCRDFLQFAEGQKWRDFGATLGIGSSLIKIDCKADLHEGTFVLETQPVQMELTHPFATQKVNVSGVLRGDHHGLSLMDLTFDSEWGKFQGGATYATDEKKKEFKIELGDGEFIYDRMSHSTEMLTFIEESLGVLVHFNSLSLAIPDNALQMRFFQNNDAPNWEHSFLLMGRLDLPNLEWKGMEIEEIEGQIIANEDEISLQEGRCSFDLPNGRKVRCEEVALLLAPERKELFSRVDIGSTSLMNLHLVLDSKGDQWQLNSPKSTLFERPLQVFAMGTQSQIDKWAITTALEGVVCKQMFKDIPFLKDSSLFAKDVSIELSSDFGKQNQFKGKVLDLSLFGEYTASSCSLVAEKEDFHFDTSLSWMGKIIQGKGCTITPAHKIAFVTHYDWEKGEGKFQIEGDSFAGKIGDSPLHLRYVGSASRDPLDNWSCEIVQLEGRCKEYSLLLKEKTECQIKNGGVSCNGVIEAFKNTTLWAKGNVELKSNVLSAALDFDLPKVHLCKNIDFLNPTKLHFETDLTKPSDIDIAFSDVEVYLVDLKDKITLCNPEAIISRSGNLPLELKAILKTSYNPFDLDVKIDPKNKSAPALFSLNDKVTGEELVGGFSMNGKGLLPEFLNGRFLGSEIQSKANGDKFYLFLKVPMQSQILTHSFFKSLSSLSTFQTSPLFAQTYLELQGNIISSNAVDEDWVFLGEATLKGFDFKNAMQGNIATRLQYRNKELSLLDLKTSDLPFDLKIKKASIRFEAEEMQCRAPSILLKNFIPSQLIPSQDAAGSKPKGAWNLTHASLIDFNGDLKVPKTWRGKGTAHFANVQKGTFSFTKTFSMALEQMGLSSSTLRPAVGDVDFRLENAKVFLEDLRSCFSEGGATTFVLTPNARHFILFDGALNIELEPKPLQGLPWTQHVHLKIKGSVEEPEYQLR